MDTFGEQPVVPPSKFPTINSIVGFCAGSGAVFGALALLNLPRLYAMIGPISWLFAVGIGAVTGFVCSVVVVPLLMRREVWRAKPIIAWGTAAMMVAWITATHGRNPWPVLAAPLVFLGFAILARVLLPAVALSPGCCVRCNYDLRGSYEIGRCPECGLPIKQTRNAPRNPARAVSSNHAERLWAYCVGRPLLLLLLLMLGGILRIEAPKVRRTWRSSPLVNALENIKPQSVIDLDALVQFDWDTVYMYGPYASLTPPANVNSTSWKRMTVRLENETFVDEGEILFVFVHHNDVVEYFVLRRWLNFAAEIMGQPIPRSEARFHVVSDSQSGRWVLTRPLFCTPSDAGLD